MAEPRIHCVGLVVHPSRNIDTPLGRLRDWAEALWAELHRTGVDVLGLVLGFTDTPSQRRLMAERGVLADADDNIAIPGASTPEEVVAEVSAMPMKNRPMIRKVVQARLDPHNLMRFGVTHQPR